MMIDDMNVNMHYTQLVGIHEQPDVIRITQSLSIYRQIRRRSYYFIYITSITYTRIIMRYAYIIYFTITIACISITITIIHYFRKNSGNLNSHI